MLFIATRYNYAKGLDGLYPRCSIFRSPRCNGVVKCNASSNMFNAKDLVEAFTVPEDGSPSFLDIALAHK